MFAAFLATPTLCSSAGTCRRPSVPKTHGALMPSIWTNDVKVHTILGPAALLAVKSQRLGILPLLHGELRNAALRHLQLFRVHQGRHDRRCCGRRGPGCMDGLDQLKLRQSIGGHIVAGQDLQQLPLPTIRQVL